MSIKRSQRVICYIREHIIESEKDNKVQSIEPLTSLDRIAFSSRPGFRKHWPFKTSFEYEMLHDYLQKVSYSILDFNTTIENGFSRENKDAVFLIATTD